MADLTGGVLACKRPYIELDPHDAERTNSTLVNCQECGTDIYAMKKNLGRGLILLCIPCAQARAAKELNKGEPVIMTEGQMIGSPHEDEVYAKMKALERELREREEDEV